MDLTIGILSYNTRDLTRRCLESILKYTRNIRYEIVVVENASRDGSLEMLKSEFPKIKLIVNKKNKFFSGGYNQIIKIARGKYFMMINSDAYLKNNSFRNLIDFMQKNDLAASEGLELKSNGEPIPTGSLFRTPLADLYELSFFGRLVKNEKYIRKIRMKKFNRRKSFEVDVGCNAFMCVRTQLLKDIGGYDENLKLYYTEDDISKRIKNKGFRIFHHGHSYVIHEEAKSTTQLGDKRVSLFYHDLLAYHLKYNNKFISYCLFFILSLERLLWKIK